MEGNGETVSRSRPVCSLIAYIAGFLLVYVLSSGPVYRIVMHHQLYRYQPVIVTVEVVYAPIILLDEHTFCSKPIEGYWNFWNNY